MTIAVSTERSLLTNEIVLKNLYREDATRYALVKAMHGDVLYCFRKSNFCSFFIRPKNKVNEIYFEFFLREPENQEIQNYATENFNKLFFNSLLTNPPHHWRMLEKVGF